MIPLNPVPNLIDQVYDRVLEAITDKSLVPGERIRQQDLAERLGVSRQPVSHALHLLHHQGLVTEIGRKGFQVTALDPDRIRHLYEMRSSLDALAARLAARRADEDESGRRTLEAALRAGDGIGHETSMEDLIALDVRFHHAIYRLSGNPVIAETLTPQWPHMRRAMASVLHMTDGRAGIWVEHAEIGGLILAGKADEAARQAGRHALEAGLRVQERMIAEEQAAATGPAGQDQNPAGQERRRNKINGGNHHAPE